VAVIGLTSVRVGVVVPVHGWSPYLAETLDGVLASDPADVVVVDDGSPSPVVLGPAHAGRCRVIRHDARGGLPAARRTGFAALDTELVALCDADDTWRPGKLAAQLSVLGESDADVCFARAEIVGPDDRPTGEVWPAPALSLPGLYERNDACVSGVLLRRDAVERAGGIAHDLPAAEDWDLWLRLAASGATFSFAPHAVVAYRRRLGAMSGDVATLACAQIEVHRRHAALVPSAVVARVGAVDDAALGAGLTRARRYREARAHVTGVRRAVLAVPGVRGRLGRRDPYR
jgi:glycosyltransferase involved in cell wall biosynthesis